jgi:hypothetical protein
MSKRDRLVIASGTDRQPLVRLRNPKTGDPLDLTNATKIQFSFNKRDRSKLVVDDTQVPAQKAQGSIDTVTFLADNVGALGNDIILQFNGVDDIDTVVGDWNAANPTNTVSHNGVGTDVISTQSLRLTDGYDAYLPVEINGDPKLGKVILRLLERDTVLLKRGPQQSFSVTIDFGTFPGGERIKGFYDRLDVLDDD